MTNKYDWVKIQRIKEDLMAVEEEVEDLNTGGDILNALSMINEIKNKLMIMKYEKECRK